MTLPKICPCVLKTSRASSKIRKWNAGVSNFLRTLHFWCVDSNRPVPSHGLKKREWTLLILCKTTPCITTGKNKSEIKALLCFQNIEDYKREFGPKMFWFCVSHCTAASYSLDLVFSLRIFPKLFVWNQIKMIIKWIPLYTQYQFKRNFSFKNNPLYIFSDCLLQTDTACT